MIFPKRKKEIQIKEGSQYLVRNWDGSTSVVLVLHIDKRRDLVIEMGEDGMVLRGSLGALSHEIIKEIYTMMN